MMSSRTAASAALDSTFGRRSLTAASNSRVRLMIAARPLTEGNDAPHPDALPLRGRDLVPDPLTSDLALELGEG